MDTVSLTPVERRHLKSRAHHLNPVVIIGEAGLTQQVLHEIDVGLRSHELIKIRVLGEDGRTARRDLMTAICEATGAGSVQTIGKMLVIYRPKPPTAVEVKQEMRSKRKTR
jgi:RNA-binding protein